MILNLSSSYPANEGDHRGSFVARFGNELEERGWRVEPLTPDRLGARAGLFGGSGLLSNLGSKPWLAAHLPATVRALGDALEALAPRTRAVIAHWLRIGPALVFSTCRLLLVRPKKW